MKKYIVSFLTIATFAVYVAYQQLSGSGEYAAANPGASVPTTSASSSTTVVSTQTPTSGATSAASASVASAGQYKDGQYTGPSINAYYGNIQVEAVISGGKLTDVLFLQYPQDRGTSIRINSQAMPMLKQEAIQAQSANVNIVSGATDSSGAFSQSLSAALSQAANS